MNYIKKIDRKIEVDKEIKNKTFIKYLNELAEEEFKSIDSIIKSTKNKCGINNMCPIYINDETIFIVLDYLYGKETMVINYCNVSHFEIYKDFTFVYFKDGMTIQLNISKYRMESAIKRVKLLNKTIFDRNN